MQLSKESHLTRRHQNPELPAPSALVQVTQRQHTSPQHLLMLDGAFSFLQVFKTLPRLCAHLQATADLMIMSLHQPPPKVAPECQPQTFLLSHLPLLCPQSSPGSVGFIRTFSLGSGMGGPAAPGGCKKVHTAPFWTPDLSLSCHLQTLPHTDSF